MKDTTDMILNDQTVSDVIMKVTSNPLKNQGTKNYMEHEYLLE